MNSRASKNMAYAKMGKPKYMSNAMKNEMKTKNMMSPVKVLKKTYGNGAKNLGKTVAKGAKKVLNARGGGGSRGAYIRAQKAKKAKGKK